MPSTHYSSKVDIQVKGKLISSAFHDDDEEDGEEVNGIDDDDVVMWGVLAKTWALTLLVPVRVLYEHLRHLILPTTLWGRDC